MTLFKGCIDIHNGQVKQIVGGSLSDQESTLKTNFVSDHSSAYYAELYKTNKVFGTHVIKLGPGCDEAAIQALKAWPGHLQIGGGITAENAAQWIKNGAAKVIVTSYLFPNATLDVDRLQALVQALGGQKDKLVIDLSCRKVGSKWMVAMNRWQTITDFELNKESLDYLSQYCSEFLIHAADVEGLCRGIDQDLVAALGSWTSIPTVYAGGAKSVSDLQLVHDLSDGKVDLTFGSALDIFGGNSVRFEDCVQWNAQQLRTSV